MRQIRGYILIMVLSLAHHPLGYHLTTTEILHSFKNLLSAPVYARRHSELAMYNPSYALVHHITACALGVPVLGGFIALVERIVACVYYFFHPLQSLVDHRRTHRLLDRVQKCPSFHSLYLQACATSTFSVQGPWKILFSPMILNVPEFNALCHYNQRTILLKESLTDDLALSYFIFELTNAINFPKVCLVEKEIEKLSQEEYVIEREQIEHEGTLLHHKIMNHAIHLMGFNPSMDIYASHPHHFGYYWQHTGKTSSHAQYYRSLWQQVHTSQATSLPSSIALAS